MLLLVFTPFTVRCLLENTWPEKKQYSHNTGNIHHPFGAPKKANKSRKEESKATLEIHESPFSSFAFLPRSGSCVPQPKQLNLQCFRCVAKYLQIRGPLPREAWGKLEQWCSEVEVITEQPCSWWDVGGNPHFLCLSKEELISETEILQELVLPSQPYSPGSDQMFLPTAFAWGFGIFRSEAVPLAPPLKVQPLLGHAVLGQWAELWRPHCAKAGQSPTQNSEI